MYEETIYLHSCPHCDIRWTGTWAIPGFPGEMDGYVHDLDARCPNNDIEGFGLRDRERRVDYLMAEMQESWRNNWCDPGVMGCACLGCANNSGGLIEKGYTREDWEAWLERSGNRPKELDEQGRNVFTGIYEQKNERKK